MSKTQHTLLIVEDCPEDREIYRHFLAEDPHMSYQILEAPLAEEGLSLFLKRPSPSVDAILLDFHMPDMTGLEFLCELKSQHISYPPIIMLTGQGNELLAVEAIKQGVQDYLVKQHLQPEILQLAVRSVIQQAQLQSLLSKKREQQRLIATTALRIRQSLDLDQILNTAIAEVQQLLECNHVGIYQCHEHPQSDSTASVIAELGERHNLPDCCGFHYALQQRSTEALTKRPTHGACEDLVTPILINSRQSASRSQASDTWGYLVAHRQQNSTWQSDEKVIVSELAVQLAIAIQQSQLLSDAQSALEESRALIEFKSRIISTISHEYRTPLAVILGSVSTLERHQKALSPEKQTHLLKMIQEKARHMTTLVDDMLLMHQCDLNQAKFEPSPLNLLQFLADLVEEQRELAGEEHELTLKISGRANGFWGDRGLLRFALSNLLSNALKYSPEGGPIEVVLVGRERTVELSIRDQGMGVPADDLPTLFDSFSRASNVGTISGTGMGLSISKACIELHNGAITLESEEGKGTTVLITLPKEPDVLNELYPKK